MIIPIDYAERLISMKVLFSYKGDYMERKFEVTTVSPRGQVTIPQDIRQMERIKEGDKMIVTYVQGYVVMRKMTQRMVQDFFKTMKQIGKHVSMEDIRATRKESEESFQKKTGKW